MQADGTADADLVLAVAAELGLDIERLKADMEDPVIQEAIDRNLALAQALRITGTPGFVVGRQILRGAVDLKTLQPVISTARAKKCLRDASEAMGFRRRYWRSRTSGCCRLSRPRQTPEEPLVRQKVS